jgi:hypothetical protein
MMSGASGGPRAIHLKDRSDVLIALNAPFKVRVFLINEKIVGENPGRAWITHLCDTSARIALEGELKEWDDVRLHLLDDNDSDIGKIYGKVTAVRLMSKATQEADIHFTSVSQDAYNIIRKIGIAP